MSDTRPGASTDRQSRPATRQGPHPAEPPSASLRSLYLQAPFWHVDGATHTVPQLPQSALLVVVSTQVPAQSTYGAAQVQALLTQVRFPPQFTPQKPQFALLLVKSTQLLPHCD